MVLGSVGHGATYFHECSTDLSDEKVQILIKCQSHLFQCRSRCGFLCLKIAQKISLVIFSPLPSLMFWNARCIGFSQCICFLTGGMSLFFSKECYCTLGNRFNLNWISLISYNFKQIILFPMLNLHHNYEFSLIFRIFMHSVFFLFLIFVF